MNSDSIKLLAAFTRKNIRYLMIKGGRLDIIRAELSSWEMTELNRVWPQLALWDISTRPAYRFFRIYKPFGIGQQHED
jgi:hypothetical protein